MRSKKSDFSINVVPFIYFVLVIACVLLVSSEHCFCFHSFDKLDDNQTAMDHRSGQKKLSESAILIVGMGGLGSPISSYLAASGVGTCSLPT